jgi:Bifunctional DNA primase/polymerase, N-terminal
MSLRGKVAAVEPGDLSWPALTGVKPRRGGHGIGEAVACWEAEQGNTVVAMVLLAQSGGEKKPIEKWKTLGFRSPEEIRESGIFRQRCGVAILTGPSKKVVVDTDGKAGPKSMASVRGERTLPRTRTLVTPNGRHRIYNDDGVDYKTQAGQMGNGIDVRGRGGLELVYDPGQPGRHYTDLHEPVSVPRWLRPKIPKADEPAPGNRRGLDVGELVANRIPPGKHDDTMLRLAMKLCANELIDRKDWPLLAQGILARSGEGTDADGRPREKFSGDRIMGWWDSAVAELELGNGEARFTIRPMSDVFEEVCEDIGPDLIAPVSGITAVIGESNVGKSPLCYYILLMRVRAGQTVGIYETEMGAYRIQKKLRELGAKDEELSALLNFGDWGDKGRDLITDAAALTREAVGVGCKTFLLDSQIGLISSSGISENDSSAVRNWSNRVCGSLASAGVGVIIIDHTGLGDDSRGRGTSDKKPSCDFAVVMKEIACGRVGVSGTYSLECTKDRSARFIGMRMPLHHIAQDDGSRSFTYKPDGWEDAELKVVSVNHTQDILVAEMCEIARPVPIRLLADRKSLDYEAVRSALRRGETGSDAVFIKVGKLWALKPVG